MRYPEVGHGGDFWTHDDYATTRVSNEGLFGEAVYAYMQGVRAAAMDVPYSPAPKTVLMTTESKWSGWSEYTITSTWTEVVLGVPEWDLECEFACLPDLWTALATTRIDDGFTNKEYRA